MNEYNEKGNDLIVSVSGGKDSTATALYCLEKNYEFRMVFADVGWEHPATYEYLNELENKIGKKIHHVQKEIEFDPIHQNFVDEMEKELGMKSPFIRLIMKKTCIPTGKFKFCTPILKVEPIKEWIENNTDIPVVAVGVRKDESIRRSKLESWEWNKTYDCFVWRPILNWTFEDVVNMHTKHKMKPNPLYLQNFKRVGCYPCIFGSKSNIKVLDDKRVNIIKRIEEYVSDKRGKKITFFSGGSIDYMHDWSKTSRGGKQYKLLETEPRSCTLWGLCE